MSESRISLMLGDMNIDKSVNKDLHSRQDVKKLVPIYEDFLNNLNLTIVNHEMTRFEINAPPSLLNHIITKEPNRLDHKETKPSLISDLKILSCLLHHKELNEDYRQTYKTEWLRVNPYYLVEAIMNNEKMSGVLRMTNSEKIWIKLIEGFNEVINT